MQRWRQLLRELGEVQDGWRKPDAYLGREAAAAFFRRATPSPWWEATTIFIYLFYLVIFLATIYWVLWVDAQLFVRIAGIYSFQIQTNGQLFARSISAEWGIFYIMLLSSFLIFATNGFDLIRKSLKSPQTELFAELQASYITRAEWVSGLLVFTSRRSRSYIYIGLLTLLLPALVYILSPVNLYIINLYENPGLIQNISQQIIYTFLLFAFLVAWALLLHVCIVLRTWRQKLMYPFLGYRIVDSLFFLVQIAFFHVIGIPIAIGLGFYEGGFIYTHTQNFLHELPNNIDIHWEDVAVIASVPLILMIIMIVWELRRINSHWQKIDF